MVYIVLAALVQLAVLALCYVAAIVITMSIETFVFGGVQRLLRRAQPLIDPATRNRAVAALEVRQRRSSLIFIAVFAATWALARFSALSEGRIALLLLAALFVTEGGLHTLLHRPLRALPPDKQKSAFAFVSRIGFHNVGALFVGILAFAYLIMPSFYLLSRIMQERLVLPTFNDVAQQFFALSAEAVKKYGYVLFTGEVAVSFGNLRNAYDPSTGTSEFWTGIVALLPVALGVWAVLLVWRLVVPYIVSLGTIGRAWKLLRLSLFFVLFHTLLEPTLVFLFHLHHEDRLIWWSVLGISVVLTVIVEHAVTAAFEARDGHRT
jgi:hypothetical protein